MAWLAGMGFIAAIGLLLAAYSRDEDARLLAVSLLGVWSFAAIFWTSDTMHLLPAIDWAVGCVAVIMWDVRRAGWLRLFIVLCAARLAIHVGIAFAPRDGLSPFYHLLNATFVTQVFLVSKSGGIRLGSTCADSFTGWVRLFRVVRPTVSGEA